MDVRRIAEARRIDAAKMSKVNLFESERFFCDVYTLGAGQEQKPHAHEGADKIYVVLEGTGRFRVAAEERAVGAGNAVLAPADSEHAVRNEGPEPLVLMVFMAPHPSYVRKSL